MKNKLISITFMSTLSFLATLSSDSSIQIFGDSKKLNSQGHGFPNCPIQKGEEGNSETLKSVQIIIRHGIRTPIYKYVNDPHANFDYGVESGQLIPRGKYYSFLLGRCIRQSYEDFLGDIYSTQKLFCQSSQRDRTMMTGCLGLAGIFPPTKEDVNSQFNVPNLNWQPIPCVTIDTVIDNKIANGIPCPAYDNAYEEFKDSNSESVEFRAKYRWLYTLLTNLTGQLINDYDDIYQLYDTINIQHDQFNLNYPFWFEHLKSEMKENNDFSFYATAATPLLQKLWSGPLMNQMVDNFNGIIGEPNEWNRKADLYLYYGHDSTVSPVLQALGIFDRETDVPTFNAAIFLELHESEQKEHFVKVFYKNGYDQKMIEKFVPDCGKICSFQKFKKALQGIVVNDKDWEQLCGKVKFNVSSSHDSVSKYLII